MKQTVEKLENELKFREQKQRKQEIAEVAYRKTLNLLLHGLSESTNPWEKKDKAVEKYEKFVSDGLKLDLAFINILRYSSPSPASYQCKLSRVFGEQSNLKAVKDLKNHY